MFVFLGFVFLCLVGLGLIAITKGSWSSDRWVALGSLGSFMQALFVLAGVIYAAIQVQVVRAEGRRTRADELIDRLDLELHNGMIPAASRLYRAWHLMDHVGRVLPERIESGTSNISPERLQSWYTDAKDEYEAASTELTQARDRLDRAVVALGLRLTAVGFHLRSAVSLLPWLAPDDVNDYDAIVMGDQTDIDRLKQAMKEMKAFVDDLLHKRSAGLVDTVGS